MIRRSVAGSLVTALAAAAVLVWAPPALAAITSTVDNGVLTVTGDDTVNSVKIKCSSSDEVRVNGEDPDSGVFACGLLTGIVVSVLGGDDRVSVEKVTLELFPAMASILIRGGDGSDVLVGSEFDDELRGETGNDDLLPAGGANNVVEGGTGIDEIVELRVEDAVVTGSMFISAGSSTFSKVEGFRLTGTKQADSIDSRKFNGRVTMIGNAGADEILAGSDYSELYGGDGKDLLSGGKGADALFGGAGSDQLLGKDGSDRLDGGTGNDACNGGAGNDETRNCE